MYFYVSAAAGQVEVVSVKTAGHRVRADAVPERLVRQVKGSGATSVDDSQAAGDKSKKTFCLG